MTADIADEWALKRLAESYAYAVDHGDEALMASLFVDDALLEGQGQKISGIAEIRALPRLVANTNLKTFHLVGPQTSQISGDTAKGVTYCVAKHLREGPNDTTICFEMVIRYQDKFGRDEAGWRFTHRNMLVDWTRTYEVELENWD